MIKFDRILFPVDFSDYSKKLNTQVEWLANKFNSTVTMLHVCEIPASWYGGADAPLVNADDIVAIAKSEKQHLCDYPSISLKPGGSCVVTGWGGMAYS